MSAIPSKPDSQVLSWPKRLLSADDLRRHLTNQRELLLLPRTIITPLALDELRAKGVRLTWQVPGVVNAGPVESQANSLSWGVAQEKADPAVNAAIEGLQREGITLIPLTPDSKTPSTWAKEVAGAVERRECRGAVVFCGNAGLVCCVANKVSGLRAASVLTVKQAAQVCESFGANLLAVEMPGRTMFEVRQILKSAAMSNGVCPEVLADILKELDGHAHR